jgi:hypothetical protein
MVTEELLRTEREILYNSLFHKIKSTKKWLYNNSGLGLMKIIQTLVLNKYGVPLSNDEVEQTKYILKLLYTNEILPRHYIKKYINHLYRKGVHNGLMNERYVRDENGNWHPVNKLDTNCWDLSDLLVDIIKNLYEDRNCPFNINIDIVIDEILNKNARIGLKLLSKDLVDIINYYYPKLEDFYKFTKNTLKNSIDGKIAEDKVIKKFESDGQELIFRGSDGNRIDMKFSIDLIFYDKKSNKYTTVQVKTHRPLKVNGQENKEVIKLYKYKHIDKVIYINDNDEVITIPKPK